MTRFIIAFAVVLTLAGCVHEPAGQREPIITTTSVNKPVAVSCVPESVGDSPTYPDTQESLREAAGTPDRFLQLLLAGRDLRIARAAEVEPVIEGCRK